MSKEREKHEAYGGHFEIVYFEFQREVILYI